jgi:signal peptidase I
MRKILKFVLVIVVCYFIAVISNAIFLEQIVVYGNSMASNLNDGEFGLADKQFYKISKLERFDVVVIKQDDSMIIKRVIGLPNEKIEYINGVLKINDQIVEENFIDESTKKNTNRNDLSISVTLKDDEYYVLGDNRLVSYDSRNIGPIKFDDIKGRVFVLYGECENLICDVQGVCNCDRKYHWPKFL